MFTKKKNTLEQRISRYKEHKEVQERNLVVLPSGELHRWKQHSGHVQRDFYVLILGTQRENNHIYKNMRQGPL